MLDYILTLSLRRRSLILTLVAAVVGLGLWNFTPLPIDAVPDITNIQVQINTEAEGFSPLESEQRITFPIETAIAGLPKLSYTRSVSRYGLSQVTVVFLDGTDIYFARQLVNEPNPRAICDIAESSRPMAMAFRFANKTLRARYRNPNLWSTRHGFSGTEKKKKYKPTVIVTNIPTSSDATDIF